MKLPFIYKEELYIREGIQKRGDNWYYHFDMGMVEGKRKRTRLNGALRQAIINMKTLVLFSKP
jgi:hypothetical protein